MKSFNTTPLRSCVLATLLLFGGVTQADILFFDFECEDGNCGGDPNWGGYWQVDSVAVASGTALGSNSGDILSFFFESSDKGGISWVLDDLSNGHNIGALQLNFNAVGDLITLIDGGSNVCNQAAAPCAGFNNDTTGDGNDFLATNASIVGEYDNQSIRGQWVLRESVPEPATLVLLGLGLAGIGYQRRRKAV